MADKKEPDEPKVEFGDDPKSKQFARKTKVHFIGALSLFLLFGIVVSLAVYLMLNKTPQSDRLTDVNLKEGDTLTYRVEQDIEVREGNGNTVQKGTVRVIVGLRVHNKTSEEYWFLVKFNVSSVSGDVDLSDIKTTTNYFLVRLRLQSSTNQGAGELIEVHGNNSTDEEKIRLVFAILQQLLPNVKRDLYQNIDGNKASDPTPEDSALLPAPGVKMHREANTSDKDEVLIKNSFNSSDVVNMTSADSDTDFKYSEYAYIKKSTGMVTEGLAHLSEQLNLGEPIHAEGGADLNMLKIKVKSRVSLIETLYFVYNEGKEANLHLFVKLIVPKSADPAVLSVNETENQKPLNLSLLTKEQEPKEQEFQAVPLKRSRRSVYYNANQANSSLIAEIWERISPICLNLNREFVVYSRTFLGVRVHAIGSVSVNIDETSTPHIEFQLKFVIRFKFSPVRREFLRQSYTIPFQSSTDLHVRLPEKTIIFYFGRSKYRYLDVHVTIRVSFWISLPLKGNSLDPLKLAIKITPVAEVLVTIKGSHLVFYYGYLVTYLGQGSLLGIRLPLSLSFCNGTLCANLSVKWNVPIYSWCKWILVWQRRWVRVGYKRRRLVRVRAVWVWVCRCTPRRTTFVVEQVCNVTKNVTSSSSSLVLPTTSSQITVSAPLSSTVSTAPTAPTASPVPTVSTVPTASTELTPASSVVNASSV